MLFLFLFTLLNNPHIRYNYLQVTEMMKAYRAIDRII